MRVVIVGAGAMGSLFGFLLHRAEKDVWLYDDWHDVEQFALARVLIAQRRAHRSGPDLQPVLEFLQRKLDAAETSNWVERQIEVWILHALALQAQGDVDRAVASL